MAIPNSTTDIITTTRALQVIQRLIELSPGVFAKHHLQMLFNLAHFPHQSVKEDVARLLLTHSSDFDDQSSLLDLQKINTHKINYDEFKVNFREEPNKSQKQILKLVRMFEKEVQTKSQYLKQINRANDKGEEDLVVPHTDKEEVQSILRQDCEERAVLLFETFNRLTSVLFDLESMVCLLKKEDLDEQTQETVAHLMFTSLIYLNSTKGQITIVNKGEQTAATGPNIVYLKYWDLATGYLKLSVLNELIQTYRTSNRI